PRNVASAHIPIVTGGTITASGSTTRLAKRRAATGPSEPQGTATGPPSRARTARAHRASPVARTGGTRSVHRAVAPRCGTCFGLEVVAVLAVSFAGGAGSLGWLLIAWPPAAARRRYRGTGRGGGPRRRRRRGNLAAE